MAADHQHIPALRGSARVDSQDDTLTAERLRQLGQQVRTAHRGRIDAHLVRAGGEQAACILHAADSAAHSQWNTDRGAHSPHGFDLRLAPLGGCRNVEDHDLVGALHFVPRRLLGGVAGVAQVLELDAFHHAAVPHVQAGDEAPQ